MAYTQDWSAGNASPPMGSGAYNPNGTLPSGNASYPKVVYAENVKVDAGKLTIFSGSSWSFCQWWEAELGSESNGWFHAQHFLYRVTLDTSDASLQSFAYCPSFLQSADNTGPTWNNAAGLSLFAVGSGASNWGLELMWRVWTSGSAQFDQSYTFSRTSILDKHIVLTLEGCCGTPTVDGSGNITAVEADGTLTGTISIDGTPTVAYNKTGIPLFVSQGHGGNRLRGYQMGAGIPGSISLIEVEWASTCSEEPPPDPEPEDHEYHQDEKICCCECEEPSTAPGSQIPQTWDQGVGGQLGVVPTAVTPPNGVWQ